MSSFPPQPPPAAQPPQPPPMPSQPPVPAQPALTRSYAEWFDWASTEFTDDHRAHLATDAAVTALRAGAEAPAAVEAGRQAATAPDAAARPLSVDKSTQAYAAWFAWARRKAGLDPQRAHLAAAAGQAAQAAGAPVGTAQAHALAAVGAGPPVVPRPASAFGGLSWRDPALRAIIYGAVCLVVPFFGFYFLILPILGLVYSIRALTQSRLAFGIVGVVLNGLATAFTAALFFRLI